MRLILTIPIIFLMSLATAQSDINSMIDDFKENGDNINIDLEGDIFQWKDEKAGEIQTRLDKVRLIIFEKGKCLDKASYNNIKELVRKEAFEDLLYVKEGNEKVEAFAKESGDVITDLFLLITSDDQSVIISVSGKILLDELKELDMNFKGFDKLKDLHKRA